jgi:hypothetical protein
LDVHSYGTMSRWRVSLDLFGGEFGAQPTITTCPAWHIRGSCRPRRHDCAIT